MGKDEKGKFVRVQCGKCGSYKILFGKSSLRVKCDRCNRLLVKNTGGKVRVRAQVREVLR